MRSRIRQGLGILVLAALAPASWAIARQSDADGGPNAWIDAPLDGASVGIGDVVEIVAHVADADGVVGADIAVDGVIVENVEIENERTIETIRTTWTANEPAMVLWTVGKQNR